MATQKGVWNLQQVRDKQLQDLWSYSAPGDPSTHLYLAGYNNHGNLGQNTRQAWPNGISSPVQVPGSWTWFSNGTGNMSHGIAEGGTLWSWGYNHLGQLGVNNTTQYSSPVQIPGTTWSKLGGGGWNPAVIKTDGTVWAWGNNEYGQLGQNNTTDYSSPKQIPGTTWAQVNASGNKVVGGVKTDGTLWVWGWNSDYGQLGQNNKTNYSSPVQIPGTTWSEVHSDENTMMGIKTDGTIWFWGRMWAGQGGHTGPGSSGPGGARSSPVQVPGTTWNNIRAAGNAGVLATRTDGTLWSWGYNQQGMLGHNTANNGKFSSPVQVGSGSDWDISNFYPDFGSRIGVGFRKS